MVAALICMVAALIAWLLLWFVWLLLWFAWLLLWLHGCCSDLHDCCSDSALIYMVAALICMVAALICMVAALIWMVAALIWMVAACTGTGRALCRLNLENSRRGHLILWFYLYQVDLLSWPPLGRAPLASTLRWDTLMCRWFWVWLMFTICELVLCGSYLHHLSVIRWSWAL